MYLNNSYFGNGVQGSRMPAKYFGVSASQPLSIKQLHWPECSRGHGFQSLYSVENTTNRRDTVLNNMVAAGYIDKAAADPSGSQRSW